VVGVDPSPLLGWQIMELAKGAAPEMFDSKSRGRGIERHPITKQTISMLKVFVDNGVSQVDTKT